ncbi:unnamed protein product [Prorocentrum cordatum]|uniref:Uncharacterized protein n=1 Tax=Prorocentrum cordatum TaxID=2364126 RepID=A0ABN9UYA3_9DINO|nr:unnamed protein product [Polarella glacialis]
MGEDSCVGQTLRRWRPNVLFWLVMYLGQQRPLYAASGYTDTTKHLDRPAIAKALIDELFLGIDPLLAEASPNSVESAMPPDKGMTHVSANDIDMVLEMAVQPVLLWLELGAFEGGSAILTARRAEARAAASAALDARTTVVAVDTFLGDRKVIWERPPEERRQLLRPDGTIALYDRFRTNVLKAGSAAALVLPLPATSVTALRLMPGLADRGLLPRPQVIYLDSAHEAGEVFLELQLAWEAVAPGGVLFGDDWSIEAVRRDVLSFAAARGADADDSLGRQAAAARSPRTLGRVRRGLFVSYLSFQWFMRKSPELAGASGGNISLTESIATLGSRGDVGEDCWSGGFGAADCCDEDRYGRGGNPKCWDLIFTFDSCCQEAAATW